MIESKYSVYDAKEITELRYNYRPVASDGKEVFAESWDSVNITDKGVKSIVEHLPQGEGDRLYYDVEYEDGKVYRTFNPCGVVYKLANKHV